MYQGDAILRRPMTSPQGEELVSRSQTAFLVKAVWLRETREEQWLYAAAARGTQVSYIYIIIIYIYMYAREHEIT